MSLANETEVLALAPFATMVSSGLKRIYPGNFAQEALGHNSQAVHRTYARRAQVLLPPLEDYEKNAERRQPALATVGAIRE